MRAEVMDALQQWYPEYLVAGEVVVELGSRAVYGGIPRTVFTGAHRYTGVDMIAGQEVDLVLNFHDLHTVFEPASVDTVLCLETLEHDDRFWETLVQVARMLKPGGHFVLSVPTLGYPTYHPYPFDYWRFSPDSFKEVLLDPKLYDVVDVKPASTDGREDGIVGIARRKEARDGEEDYKEAGDEAEAAGAAGDGAADG